MKTPEERRQEIEEDIEHQKAKEKKRKEKLKREERRYLEKVNDNAMRQHFGY